MNAANNKKKLIFIVEDNAVYAKSLELYLKTRFENIELMVFPVGELCVDNLDMEPFLIVLDYELNSRFFDAENGLDVIKEIRAKDKNRQVVVLSSQEDPAVEKAVKDAGCVYFRKNADAFKKIENHISLMTINTIHHY